MTKSGVRKKSLRYSDNLLEMPRVKDRKPAGKSKKGNFLVPIMVAILTIFGTVMIFSASYYLSINEYGTPYHYLIRQIVWLITGVLIMWFFARVDYHLWANLWFFAYIIGFIFLILVFVIGSNAYGATRWIKIGPITIMPGEMAKMAMIIFITGYFSRHPKWGSDIRKGVVPILGLTGIYALLIIKQPNLSTAATVVFIAMGMLIVAGIKWSHVIGLIIMGAFVGVAAVMLDTTGYRMARIQSFLDPFADPLSTGYNVVQSLLALGTGGVTGLGLGNSVQKTLYLPMPQNDFILAIVGEELGFLGILFLVICYIILMWCGCKIAIEAKDYTGMMFASGITIMLGVQVFINFAVVTSCMPPTGVILPFISYGGNALWIFMALMGILVNISKK